MDVFRYYLGFICQLIGIGGIVVGGPWAWAGVAQLPIFAALDPLLGDDLRERKAPRNEALMDIPLVLCAVFGPITLAVLAWKVGQGGLGAFELLGMIASGAWLALVPVVPAAHELYHKRSPWKYALGTYTQFPYMDCTRSAAHMMSHHIHVGTPKDADTPIRGENMYSFILRTIPENYRELYNLEKEALAKRGLSVWAWQGRFTKAIVAYLAFLGVLLVVGGPAGLAAGFAATLIARLWVEAFNYLQHVGLIRVPGEPIEPRHVWNHLGTVTRVAAFEITNHCDHHQDAYVPYYKMRPDEDGPRMPNAFLCFLAAVFPPLWKRSILWPRLKDWDLHHASPAERALAREANRKAGWPDWFDEAPAATPRELAHARQTV
jgi:p-cymene methyl-monooxygenase